jgi:predicted component of viral defense system (DUF524 family)
MAGMTKSSVWTWKPEDINKMHTYREAITGVAGSFVLFPGFHVHHLSQKRPGQDV